MKNNMNNKDAHLAKFGIYKWKKNKMVYYNQRKDTAYHITEDNLTLFKVLQLRHFLIFFVTLLLYNYFHVSTTVSLIAFAIIFFIVEIYYHLFFIKNLKTINHFVMRKDLISTNDKNKVRDKNNEIYKSVIYILIGIISIILAFIFKLAKHEILIIILLSGISIVMGLLSFKGRKTI